MRNSDELGEFTNMEYAGRLSFMSDRRLQPGESRVTLVTGRENRKGIVSDGGNPMFPAGTQLIAPAGIDPIRGDYRLTMHPRCPVCQAGLLDTRSPRKESPETRTYLPALDDKRAISPGPRRTRVEWAGIGHEVYCLACGEVWRSAPR